MGYHEDLQIDRHDILHEFEKQADLYMKYAVEAAQALMERDRAKEKFEVIKAEIDEDIRLHPEKFGFDKKPTESALIAQVIQEPSVREANDELIKAAFNARVLEGAKEAFNHKKAALESIAKLMTSVHWADPVITPMDRQGVEEKQASGPQREKLGQSPRLQERKK